ncbi:hypothetical protein RND71_011070 [Anisodus tanguticus]|uniref:Uncharacterized protein n=1 Tax=Anisodus tanguticus TaxID=243964 RepID=A0AAE1SKI2_9SOLA|nr:hypothetical protein RND71_011070 [Anisodus tanguticus]
MFGSDGMLGIGGRVIFGTIEGNVGSVEKMQHLVMVAMWLLLASLEYLVIVALLAEAMTGS